MLSVFHVWQNDTSHSQIPWDTLTLVITYVFFFLRACVSAQLPASPHLIRSYTFSSFHFALNFPFACLSLFLSLPPSPLLSLVFCAGLSPSILLWLFSNVSSNTTFHFLVYILHFSCFVISSFTLFFFIAVRAMIVTRPFFSNVFSSGGVCQVLLFECLEVGGVWYCSCWRGRVR